MSLALVVPAAVIAVPIVLMLATCLLARVESTLVPAVSTRVLPTKPSAAPPSRRLTLVAAEAPEAPDPAEALPQAS